MPASASQRRSASGPWRCMLLAVLLAALAGGARAQAPAGEMTLKAQFIVEFASLIKYSRPRDPAAPFVLAVVGESPFREELGNYARDRKVHGRPLLVRTFPHLPEGQDLDLVFICRSEWPRARAIVDWSRTRGALTVAEGQQLAAQGVMVNLLVEGGYLRLGLNLKALEEGGFNVGAPVMKVARILVPSPRRP